MAPARSFGAARMWLRELDQARQAWDGAEPVEKLQVTNRLLRTLEDSHSAVSTMHWIWDVEKRRGTIPFGGRLKGGPCGSWTLGSRVSLPKPACSH